MFLPDAFKLEVLNFFNSPAGQAFMLTLRQRRPNAGEANTPYAHTLIDGYANQKGYDACISEIDRIPRESDQLPPEKLPALLDPRD